jgi:hypothetical protein
MVGTKIEEIKLKFESDLRAMMGQYVEAKSLLAERDKTILHLKELIKQQETTILTYRKQIDKFMIHDEKQNVIRIELAYFLDINNCRRRRGQSSCLKKSNRKS